MNEDFVVALLTITFLLIIIAGELSVISSRAAECLSVLEQIRNKIISD